jgi:hypothetical protein
VRIRVSLLSVVESSSTTHSLSQAHRKDPSWRSKRSGSDPLLLKGEESEEDQLASVSCENTATYDSLIPNPIIVRSWFFNAFGPILEPNVCVLLDVGTMPGPDSIYHLWKAFDINSNVGGACGEIVALKGKYWQNLLNPLGAFFIEHISPRAVTYQLAF